MQKIRSISILLLMFFLFSLRWSPTLFAVSATTSRLAQATFAITAVTPDGTAIVALTAPIRATFNADLNMNSVTLQAFVVQSNVRGRLGGAFTYDGNTRTLTFTPARAFVQGEIITVIATSALTSNTAATLTPYQWRFTPGHIEQRCIESFVPYEDDFTNVWSSTGAWGDYDNDGDLDAVVAGQTSGNRVTYLYRNEGSNIFLQLIVGLPGIREGSVAWGDYDNDGDLDILLAGESSAAQITQVYRNDGNSTFTNINALLTGVWLGEATWSDYNNDGYLDILVAGQSNNASVTRLYRNNQQGNFVEVSVPFVGVNNGAADWGDYDNDGDLDLLLTGEAGVAQSIIYRNDGNDTFVNINANLAGVRDSAVAWGDYNGDGHEDILLTGNTAAFVATTRIYRNNGNGTFTDSGANLTGVSDGAVAWGDYDNDGDADIVLNGKDISEESTTQIYRNDSGGFTAAPFSLPAVSLGSVGWGDYDNDLDLDILLTGLADDRIVTGVYQNRDCPSDVAITKQATPNLITTSQPVTYTVTFINYGPVTATKVIITDTLPGALTNVQVVSTTSNAGITLVNNGANPPFSWNVSNLPIQQGGTITITGNLTPEPGAVYTNTVRISAMRDVTFTNNLATAAIMAPFRIIQTSPPGGGTLSATPGGPVQATFEANLNPTSINGATLKVIGSQSGYLGLVNPSYDSGNRTYTFQTNRAWKMGETISVIGTTGVKSAAGAPLIPYQWQFVGGRTSPRCVGEFTDLASGLPAVTNGVGAWGDYDGDGDLDLLLSGQGGGGPTSGIYRNDGGRLVNLNAAIANVNDSAAAWGDYEGDGDLDLLLTGHTGLNPLTNLYRNDNGLFTAIDPPLPPLTNGAVAWGDYDNDGDLDLLLAGNSDNGRITRIYRNDDLTFIDSNANLPGITDSTVAWGDYDKDGDLDLFLTGSSDGGPLTAIYQNNSGAFTNLNAGLTAVEKSAATWGDYDNDTDLDLLITGNTGATRLTQLYRNTNGVFATTNPGLPAVDNGAVAWGDYDNDGVLDLFLTGDTGSGALAAIYRQQGGVFTDFGAGLPGVATGAAALWGDYDRDGDVDLLVSGTSSGAPLTTLRRNTNCISDTRIVKSVKPAVAEANDVITYTLTFSNAGPQPALGVQIRDLLPVDLTNVQVAGAMVSAGVAITETAATPNKSWQVSKLAVGQGGVITVTALVLPGVSGAVFTNTAVITSIHDITLTNNLATAPVGRPFYITDTVPGTPTVVGIPLANPIRATFDADVNAGTATVQNLAVYGQQSGLRSGAVSYDGASRTLIFTPTVPLHHGEVVDVIGLAALQSVAGAPLAPYQWQFVAGRYVDARCIAEFKPLTTALPALTRSTVAWGDYDKDDDLDVVVVGSPDGTNRQSTLYRNDGNSLFTDSGATLEAVYDGAVGWGDYDKDGDLDLLLAGSSQSGPITRLYRNDNGLLSIAPVAFPGLSNSSMAWGDYDNDGDLDLALAGTADGSNGATLIYRNDGNGFTNSTIAMTGSYRGKVAWGDSDGDGDLDLLVTGTTNGSTGITHLYRNDEGNFVNLNLSLPGLYDSDAAWGDYDNDGDLDFILMGTSDGTTRLTTLLRNDGGNLFTGVTTSLPALSHGSAAWGDYENDGDLDLLLTGTTNGATPFSRIFLNQGVQGFNAVGLPMTNLSNGDAAWHDYDGDADLDLLLTGSTEGGVQTQLYRSIDCVSDLALTKSVTPASVLPGELITYTLNFSNLGPQPATRIVLTDVLPLEKLNDLQINSSHPITQIGPPYIWRMADIAPGAGGTITIVGRTSFLATGIVITNTATIHAREDVTPTNDVALTLLTVRAPQANFAIAAATIDEQNGQATVTVTLNEPNMAGAVTLLYQSTAQGTAQAGSDYTPVNGTLQIPLGTTSATFTIPIQDDALDEDNETVVVNLSNPVGAVLGGTTTLSLTITDNDAEPTVSIADVTVNENAGSAVFALTLNAPSGRAVSVTASTADSTATAPADYTALSNAAITIPAGQTTATITVEIKNDEGQEESEQFFINLTSPLNVALADNQATGTIDDNDSFGAFLPIVWR